MYLNQLFYNLDKYCSTKSMPTMPLYAFWSLSVIGPGIPDDPISAPFIVETGTIQKLVEVIKTSSAVGWIFVSARKRYTAPRCSVKRCPLASRASRSRQSLESDFVTIWFYTGAQSATGLLYVSIVSILFGDLLFKYYLLQYGFLV